MHLSLRRLLIAATLAILPTSHLLAQTPTPTPVTPMAAAAHPSFAVATIRLHDPNSSRQGFEINGDSFSMLDVTVVGMMTYAYAINRHQVGDGPGWLGEERFDVIGRADIPGEPNLKQQQEMLQKLLADRFALHFHKETRSVDVYALRIAKGGPKLTPAADPQAKFAEHATGHGLETTRTYTSASLSDFVLVEQFFSTTRPLVDQTGLTGRYDFKLSYTYDEVHNTDPDAPPGMFTAIQDELGLNFEPAKAPVEVFVIDHVEKPSEN